MVLAFAFTGVWVLDHVGGTAPWAGALTLPGVPDLRVSASFFRTGDALAFLAVENRA